MLRATWLSAIATAFSAIAAIVAIVTAILTTTMQVHATYSNTVYTKQVDTLASIGTAMNEIWSAIAPVRTQFSPSYDTFARRVSVYHDRALIKLVDSTYVDVQARVAELTAATNGLRLIEPSELDPWNTQLVTDGNAVATTLYNLKMIVDASGTPAQPSAAAFAKTFDDAANDLAWFEDTLLMQCVRPALQKGQYLVAGAISPACVQQLQKIPSVASPVPMPAATPT